MVASTSGYAVATLVGDVGGTHARFALADLSDPTRPALRSLITLPSADFKSLAAAIGRYRSQVPAAESFSAAVVAIAGPVKDGEAILTNLAWHSSEAELRGLGFGRARLINDYHALAAAAATLGKDDLIPIGPPCSPAPDATVAIMGAGTGFGVAALVRERNKAVISTGEGGHIGFSPEDEMEMAILRVFARRFGRVSVERIISGPGLVNLYAALSEIAGTTPEFSDPPQILKDAECGNGLARETIERFCAIMGAVAGDIALVYGAYGGVFIAGGLSEALAPFLKKGGFRARFEGKGRLSHLTRAIPTSLIVQPNAALLGCARLAGERSGD